jgi:hypothetical protein
MSKQLTLFDHLDGITNKKTKWEDLDEADRKTFGAYMINRFLSMNMDLTEFIAEYQKYTISVLKPREVYKLYSDILPKKKIFFKYIKGKSEDKYNPKLIEYTAKYYVCSFKEAEEYLDILFLSKEAQAHITSILQAFGVDPKEIKKILK